MERDEGPYTTGCMVPKVPLASLEIDRDEFHTDLHSTCTPIPRSGYFS